MVESNFSANLLQSSAKGSYKNNFSNNIIGFSHNPKIKQKTLENRKVHWEQIG